MAICIRAFSAFSRTANMHLGPAATVSVHFTLSFSLGKELCKQYMTESMTVVYDSVMNY
jgi:hypothetical protein